MGSPATLPDEAYAWRPQPRQALALACPVEDLGYGGARGGGKTDWLIEDWANHERQWKAHARGLLVRRTFDELEEVIERSHDLYPHLGAGWSKVARTWTWPSGAKLRMRYLARDEDASRYQGWSITWLGVEEMGNFPNPNPIDKLRACLRSPYGVRCLFRSTFNPGGRGHGWIKARYIEPWKSRGGKPGKVWRDEYGTLRTFIPSLLEDNQKLTENDPNYWQRVVAAAGGNEALLKAWRWGDWDVFAGQALSEWRQPIHTCKPFPIPPWARIYMSFDWGFGKPFSLGWWWVDQDSERLYRAFEWYGWTGEADQGIRLADSAIAEGILEREREWGLEGREIICLAGPDCFAQRPDYRGGGRGPSTAEVFAEVGRKHGRELVLTVGDDSRKAGKRQFHERLRLRDGGPMMLVYENCEQFIRTIPALVVAKNDPEDIDTLGEDHCYDEARFVLMARPMSYKPVPAKVTREAKVYRDFDPQLRDGSIFDDRDQEDEDWKNL